MMRGFRVAPTSRSKLRAQALNLRSQLGVVGDWFPIVELLDLGLGSHFPNYIFDVLEPELMGDDHGLTIPDEGIIFVREDVYVRAKLGQGRDRFTCTHEFAHLVLHRGVALARTQPSEVPTHHPAYEDSEWQADNLAAELLMPVETVRRCSYVWELTQRCGVTEEAALVRIRVLRQEGVI